MNDLEDRAVGCLLGLAIGDALGTTLEFSARDSKPPVADLIGGGPFGLKPGEWTDDTSMVLCLADSLLEHGAVIPRDLMERFCRWREEGYNSVNGRCFDIGITTSQAISRYVSNGNPLAGSTNAAAAGNGSIMRLAPVPILFARRLAKAAEAAVLQSRTTHAAPECLDACGLMAAVMVRLIGGLSWREAISQQPPRIRSAKINRLATGAWRQKDRAEIKSSGYVVDTLEAAFWAVDRTGTFSDAVLLAVNLGDDADTVGAVAGQLAGARYGAKGIPPRWIKRLAWSSHIADCALQLICMGDRSASTCG